MSQVVFEKMHEQPGGVDVDEGSRPSTVVVVSFGSDPTTQQTWTFTASEGTFPSWAWR